MAAPSPAMSPEKFNPFNIHTTSYKLVRGHSIGVDVLVPKELKPGLRPLMVRFHGGFLVTGASLFPWFFTSWILELASFHSAIIVSADYRLLPEANGREILADITDLWDWIGSSLQPYLASVSAASVAAPQVDMNKILVVGDSAGGWIAVQSALAQPRGYIRALIALYPQVDMRDDHFTKKYEKSLFHQPMLPSSIVDDHLAATAKDAVVSSATPMDRIELACSIVQNGRMLEFLGDDPALFPIEAVEKVGWFPPVLILHGTEDTAVPTVGSKRFVEALKKSCPQTPVRLTLRPGDHGFDEEVTLETEWFKPDVRFVVEHWLG